MGQHHTAHAKEIPADNDASQILDTLWLSSHHTARDYKTLTRLGITHVVAITKEFAMHFQNISYKHLHLADNSETNIAEYFTDTSQWIGED
jgi:hypothetical protein